MNIPLACLPIAFGLIFVPKIPIAIATKKQLGKYDNKAPREQQEKLEGWGRRAVAAHQNAFESFPGFAAGVLACTITGKHADWAAILAVTHVVARALYPWFYVKNIDAIRSSIWAIGFATTLGLMFLAAI